MSLNLVHIVPELDKHGGIQTMAKDVISMFKNSNTFNWKVPFIIFRLLLKILPIKVSLQLIKIRAYHFLKKNYVPNKNEIIHCWHLDCASAYINNRFIVTCYGRELLKKNVIGYKQYLYQQVFDRAYKIHVITNFTRKLLLSNFKVDEEKITVIPPAITCTQDKVYKREKIKIGTLSRFNRRKNILNIVKALELLYNSGNTKFEYILAGDGEQKKEILSYLSKVNFKWKYLGQISDSTKLKEFYPDISLFVLPTLNLENDIEGFGIVYLEANSYGIPVIASNVGGVSEAVIDGQTGLFVNPLSIEDIKDKIDYAITNISKFECKSFLNNFKPDRLKIKYINLYK